MEKNHMSNDKQISFDTADDRSQVVQRAITDAQILSALVENLSSDQRRMRQFSAAAIKEVALQSPEILLAHVPAIADGLHRPEAQTRWECLEALAYIAPLNPSGLDEVIEGAETSLFDEESGMAHLAAIRFLCAYGAQAPERATAVWPLIDEGIQVYHGDAEFVDMLTCVESFISGNIDKKVRQQVGARMAFDADNYSGAVGRLSAQIVQLSKKG